MTIKPIQGAVWKRGFGITAILGVISYDHSFRIVGLTAAVLSAIGCMFVFFTEEME